MEDKEINKDNWNIDLDRDNGDTGNLAVPEISGTGLTSLMHSGSGLTSPFMKDIYLRKQPIVGTRFQGGSDELVEDLEAGSRITFLREPDNAFDRKAVMALDEQGRKLGYMPRRENELVSALMDAGKYFYGIITRKPEETNYSAGRIPGSIWVDLYMREFALPDDLSQIPLQGYRGSYAVVDMVFTDRNKAGTERRQSEVEEKRERCLSEAFIIKVIHGEEKGRFHRLYVPDHIRDGHTVSDISKDNPDPVYLSNMDHISEYDQMITDIEHFIGHLPLVLHGISEEDLSVLQEDYGMALGKTFSNRIIDTRRMAQNHLPQVSDYSIFGLAGHLGIDIHYDHPGEERCRIIWQLYCRMERSELEKKSN